MLIRTQKSLRQAINEKRKTITDEELFLSNSYKDFLNAMISGVTKRFGQPVLLEIKSENEESSAYTDGNRIHINYTNKLINNLERKDKNSAIIASVLHECGHILFTDFKLNEAVCMKLIQENYLYPQPPKSNLLDDFNMWLLTNNAGTTLLPLYRFLDNSIEDGYVDHRIISCIPGYGQSRIWYKKIIASGIPSYEEMKVQGMDKITILLNMILSYAKHGILNYNKDLSGNDELIKIFYEVKLLIDEAVKEYNSIERKRKVNDIFIHTYSIIAEELNRQQQNPKDNQTDNSSSQSENKPNDNKQNGTTQTGDNTNGSGTDQNSQNKAQNASESISQGNSDKSTSNTENGSQGNTEAIKNAQKGQIEHLMQNVSATLEKGKDDNHKNTKEIRQPENTPAESSNMESVTDTSGDDQSTQAQNLIDQLAAQAAEEKVAKEQEKEIETEQSNQLRQISKQEGYHKNVRSSMKRATVTPKAEQLYEALHTQLDMIAKRLVKNLQKEIKDRQLGDTMNGLYMGKRLDNRSLYRKDKKIFTKKIQPENVPDMEISLLIDESGSMNGERIDVSMKTAYILYTFCNILQIPVSVYGHRISGDKVEMSSYTDGTSLDGKDRIRIFDMSAGGCNRDGYALRFCLNRLKESEASIKLMLIISDGRPNATGYHKEEGKIDIQDAVAEAKKFGIQTIAAAIGDDRETIKYIYTEGISEKKAAMYLDISDLDRLPKLFPQLIKRYLQ